MFYDFKKNIQIFYKGIIFLCLISIIISCTEIENKKNIPNINLTTNYSITECIYKFNYNRETLKSLDNHFTVTYVTNADNKCINPNFPIIEVKSQRKVNAWLQIIRTDSKYPQYQIFVDTIDNLYPFYSKSEIFYDAPLWHYTVHNIPTFSWSANLYALSIQDNKIISCLGGINWGFNISKQSQHPQIKNITPLSLDDWLIDKKLIKDYHFYRSDV